MQTRPSTSKIIDVIRKYENRLGVVAGFTIDNHADEDLNDCRIYYISKIKELLDYVGESHRLLYGTDWPICSMASYLSFVRKLELDKRSIELLMFKNAKRVFKL